MACCNKKTVYIYCGINLLFILIIVTTILILALTIFKPKQPKITTQQVTLDQLNISFTPLPDLKLKFGIVVSIYNPNYGSFRYDNTTVYVQYHSSNASEAPIKKDTVPARGSYDVGTEIGLDGDNLVTNPYFWEDFRAGCLNFTSSTTLKGKAKILKLLSLKATVYSTCDISVYISAQNITASCRSKVDY